MIGGEERNQPFYPPETVALTIADILQKYHKNNILPTITVCLYRAAAERFNSAGHAYYPESEQIIHIKQCLRKLDISDEDIDAIVFISSDTDAETQRYIHDFLNPETQNPLVQSLEQLYEIDSDFHHAVDAAVLEKFRREPWAYKYVLFELAMILIKKPAIKAGDIREKKYDEIVRKFREKLGWESQDDEKSGAQPFQTIYWNRDNTSERYYEYITRKEKHGLLQKNKRIRTIQATVAASVLAFLSMSGFGYWVGKSRWLRDARYGAISAMGAQNNNLYDAYTTELLKIVGGGDAHYHLYRLEMVSSPQNNFLLEGADWRDSQGRIVPGIFEIMQKNRHRISREVAYSIIAKMKLLNLPVDQTRWQIYESMVFELSKTFLESRIFRSREEYEKTVLESDVLKAAERFLVEPLVSPPRFNTVGHDLDFEEWLSAWYLLTIEGLHRDVQNGLQYMVYHDAHSGTSYSGPDALIPIRREMLLTICESFFPSWKVYRSYEPETVARIQALYRLLLPTLEKHEWDYFEYHGKALEHLANDPEVIRILQLNNLDPAHLTNPETLQYLKQARFWMGYFYEAYPDPKSNSINENIRQHVRENWVKQKEFMFSIGGQTPEQYLHSLEELARQYEK